MRRSALTSCAAMIGDSTIGCQVKASRMPRPMPRLAASSTASSTKPMVERSAIVECSFTPRSTRSRNARSASSATPSSAPMTRLPLCQPQKASAIPISNGGAFIAVPPVPVRSCRAPEAGRRAAARAARRVPRKPAMRALRRPMARSAAASLRRSSSQESRIRITLDRLSRRATTARASSGNADGSLGATAASTSSMCCDCSWPRPAV